jgi:hypothetical protein
MSCGALPIARSRATSTASGTWSACTAGSGCPGQPPPGQQSDLVVVTQRRDREPAPAGEVADRQQPRTLVHRRSVTGPDWGSVIAGRLAMIRLTAAGVMPRASSAAPRSKYPGNAACSRPRLEHRHSGEAQRPAAARGIAALTAKVKRHSPIVHASAATTCVIVPSCWSPSAYMRSNNARSPARPVNRRRTDRRTSRLG